MPAGVVVMLLMESKRGKRFGAGEAEDLRERSAMIFIEHHAKPITIFLSRSRIHIGQFVKVVAVNCCLHSVAAHVIKNTAVWRKDIAKSTAILIAHCWQVHAMLQ